MRHVGNHTNEDTLLIRNLIAGDENAFNTIFHHHYKSLCIYASRYTGQSDCEGIVQEVMLWLWENRGMLPQDVMIRPFLYSAVKNKCINKITHLRMRYRVLGEILGTYECLFDTPDSYERGEIVHLLATALLEFPEGYRETFVMNRFHNMTYSEIAKKTGISQKTVAYRISQTLKKLRVVFKDYLSAVILLCLLV